MMQIKAKILPIVTLFFILSSCKHSNSPDVSNIQVNVQIQRIEHEIFSCKTKEDIKIFLKKNENFVHEYYQTSVEDTALINRLYLITHFPAIDSLYKQSESTFANLDGMKKEFEDAFRHIKYYYPDFKEPKIVTTFTALDKDLYVSDSLIVISLENFIGQKAQYRPQLPNYILNRYKEPYIVPAIIRTISERYNATNANDQTLMADMIFAGKGFEFTKMMMPQTADSLIIGYTDEQLESTAAAQDLVYAHFVVNKAFYETNNRIKEKYMGERPITNEIGKDCPGRIGQWLGWRIVRRYRTENPSISLQDLMKNSNSREIFEKSKYKGQVEDNK